MVFEDSTTFWNVTILYEICWKHFPIMPDGTNIFVFLSWRYLANLRSSVEVVNCKGMSSVQVWIY